MMLKTYFKSFGIFLFWLALTACGPAPMKADAPVIQMKRVMFKGGTDNLEPGSFKELDRIFNFLNTHQDLKFEIVCYVHDTQKDSLTNHMLAMRRARNVKKYLVKKGIDYNRLIVRGYVNTQPVKNSKGKIDLNVSNRAELQRVK